MIEQQLRNLELSEPPLGFDPDVVVDRIKVSAKRRRAMIGAGVAVAAVLTAGLLVPTLRSSEHPQAVAGAGGSSSAGQPGQESPAWEHESRPAPGDIRSNGSNPGAQCSAGCSSPTVRCPANWTHRSRQI